MDVVRSLADRIIVLHNGQLVADGEPAEVIASPIVQEAYLGIAPEGRRHEREPAHACRACIPISGAITSCRASISSRPRARPPCCSAATAPARRRRCAPIMGLWQASRGEIMLGDEPHRGAARPRISPARGVGYVPETMAVFSDLTVKENLVLGGARRAARRRQARLDFRLLPGAEKVLAVARRHAVRRTEADAVDRPRHRRAAQAAPDRRADQGPGAGDRRRADRMPRGDQAHAARPSCWSSRISASRRSSATTCA